MNLTVLENRLDQFTNVMKGVADDLHYFRKLCEQKMEEEEARKDEHEAWKKHEKLMRLCFKKGDNFLAKDDIKLPKAEGDVDPDTKIPDPIISKNETLEIREVDCLTNKYEVIVTIFRCDCGIDFTLTKDQLKKLVENELLELIEK